jgi:hypothetical protein
MKKVIGIALVLALAVMLVPSAVFAADPVFSAVMDVASGKVDITVKGFDTSTWHPGVLGETNTFSGLGGFSGSYKAYDGPFGALNSYINVKSYAGGANFVMTDKHDFDIISGNGSSHVVGDFKARAAGDDANVIMNMASIGTMYIWSESEVYSYPPLFTNSGLQGGLIEKSLTTTQGATILGDLYMGCTTTGLAKSGGNNSWGWGDVQGGTATANYGGSPQTMLATGSGDYLQTAFGKNYLNFNGDIAGGGGTGYYSFHFNDGFTKPYNMEAR